MASSRDARRFQEHAEPFDALMRTLERAVPISSIMVPWSMVCTVCSDRHDQATRDKARRHMNRLHYSGVPLVSRGRVLGIYQRFKPGKGCTFQNTNDTMFIDANATVLDLLRHMRDQQQPVMVVGSADQPQGWVTYADFSKRPVRILLFALLAELEHLLARCLDETYPGDGWVDLLDEPYRRKLAARRRNAEHWDVLMPMTTFADLGWLVHAMQRATAACERLVIDKPRQLIDLHKLRNRVAHAVRPVIAGPKAIGTMARKVDRMLAWAADWSERLDQPAPAEPEHDGRARP